MATQSKTKPGLFPLKMGEWLDPRSFFNRDFPFFGNHAFNWNLQTAMPSVNISEKENAFFIELAAPGLEKSDFKIEVEDQVLTISAEKKEEHLENKKNYKRQEFSYNSFSRSFSLPENTNTDDVQATYEKGILLLTIPKVVVNAVGNKKEVKVG
ncbi:MAG: Hsp20/alpha crystallin family protein [Bacteroidetes bacterium]|nr:Hsp20/alpha crystallin family protein [Bacteroidota bacterium]